MSEPTKFLPDESIIQEWAAEHAKGSMHPFDALAAEILRLRAELAKASAEVQRLGDLALNYKHASQSAHESLRKAEAEVQRMETAERLRSFSPPKPHQFTGAEALAPSYEASQAAKVEEWNTTTDDCQVSTERLAELRASYAAGAAKESMSEPTRSRCRDAVRALDELLEVRATKDAPPADVLGEAFRKHLEGVNDIAGGLDKRLVCTFYALLELSDVVERIARAQRGGK